MSKKKETSRKWGLVQIVFLLLLGAVLGGSGRILTYYYKTPIQEFIGQCKEVLEASYFWLLLAVSAFSCLFGGVCVWRTAHGYRKWDGEEEVLADKLEKNFQRYYYIMNFLSILCISLSGMVVVMMKKEQIKQGIDVILVFAVSMLWLLVCIDQVVKYQKKMNPEKKGHVLSWSFDREWLRSCDEREKRKMFRAAYHTYRVSQFLYMAVFILLILLSNIMQTGVLPFFILAVIWCSQILVYLYEYEHKN